MSVPGPAIAVFATLVALACLFGAALCISPRCPSVWAAMAVAVIFAFFLFKNSTVRQDGPHVAPFFGKLALISLFFWVLKSTRRVVASLVALHIALLTTGYVFVERMAGNAAALRRLSGDGRAGTRLFHWPQTWRRFETEALRNLQPGWLPAPFHKAVGNGTVDAVPWNVSGVIANGWRWQPRPVFQSYAAFTPALDHLNARHIQSAAAADFALVNWETIDSRHPFFEDPSSWKARLDHYASDYSDNHTLLCVAGRARCSSERLNSATFAGARMPPYLMTVGGAPCARAPDPIRQAAQTALPTRPSLAQCDSGQDRGNDGERCGQIWKTAFS